MRAAVLHEIPGELVIDDVRTDKPESNEVLIQTTHAGLCHSDLHFMEGHWQIPLPCVMGHESAGVVQAVGGSITFAASFAVMLPEFPPTKRSTAIGIAGATGGLGAVVGPVVGSALIDVASWRAIFWVNVPLCCLVLFLGPRLLRESRDPDATGKIDPVGVPKP